jgi:hypothetical protein
MDNVALPAIERALADRLGPRLRAAGPVIAAAGVVILARLGRTSRF